MTASSALLTGDPSFIIEPAMSVWRNIDCYDSRLTAEFIEPLNEAARANGVVPPSVQMHALRGLHWYFTVDLRERAPTVLVTRDIAPSFHDRMRRIMQHIDTSVLEELDDEAITSEVRHILHSYKDPRIHTPPTVDAYDHDQGLVRLSYFVYSSRPTEEYCVDGVPTQPAFAKYRACHCYHRTMLRQRIVWLPISQLAKTLSARLDGQSVSIGIGAQPFKRDGSLAFEPSEASNLLADARKAYPPGKGGQQSLPAGWAGWKVRFVKALARALPIRRRFAKAWVFIDREGSADDNAEHLYRWVRENHPEVNAWFLLDRNSADWSRLESEGFRLIPQGIGRRLLILNSEHILSSHTEFVFGGMDRRLYGAAMNWRYTFLQHGVIKDELSHWLGPREFDRFITSSPAEHQSVVGDDTAYPYTDREVKRTGLPRHDRLLRISRAMAPKDINTLLVMPTWRGGLVDERSSSISFSEQLKFFASSDYAKHWRSFLRNEEIREMAARAGQRVAFMPHANAAKFIDAFDPPSDVDIVTAETSHIQTTFARAACFVTDYTSVAFTMAFLRRPVFYYQFDQERFYSGDHNWRVGYFNYDRDGFGPVSLTETDIVSRLRNYFLAGCAAEPIYLDRMIRAMPEQDDLACRRVFDSVCRI